MNSALVLATEARVMYRLTPNSTAELDPQPWQWALYMRECPLPGWWYCAQDFSVTSQFYPSRKSWVGSTESAFLFFTQWVLKELDQEREPRVHKAQGMWAWLSSWDTQCHYLPPDLLHSPSPVSVGDWAAFPRAYGSWVCVLSCVLKAIVKLCENTDWGPWKPTTRSRELLTGERTSLQGEALERLLWPPGALSAVETNRLRKHNATLLFKSGI